MRYYKMGDRPYYLFYRPYHLCHVETPSAIASVVLRGEAIMTPDAGRLSDVYAFAKRDLTAGTVIDHGIGGDEFYGLIETCQVAEAEGLVTDRAARGRRRPQITYVGIPSEGCPADIRPDRTPR